MGNRFYVNEDETYCVNETWLTLYLHLTEHIDEQEIIDRLRSGEKYFGWRQCGVSFDIEGERF